MAAPSRRGLTDARLDRTLVALADPTRRAILERLSRGEARVTELAEPFAWVGRHRELWAGRLHALDALLEAEDQGPAKTQRAWR